MFRTWNGRTVGIAARRDDDLLRRDPLAADIQRVGVDKGGAGVEDGGSGVVQQAAVDALQPGDLAVFGGDQGVPVVRALGDGPAEALRVLGPGAVFTGLDQQFLGDAADIDAGSAPETFLGDTGFRAVPGGDARATNASRAAADDEEIKVH